MNARRARKERELHLVIAELSETTGLSRDLVLRLSEKVNAVCDEHWVALERLQERLDKVEQGLERSEDEKSYLKQRLEKCDEEKNRLQLELARCTMEKEKLEHQLERTKSERDTWRARSEMLQKERLMPSQDVNVAVDAKKRKRQPGNVEVVQQSSQQSAIHVASGPPTPSAESSAVEPWLRRPTPSKKLLEPSTPPPLPNVRELDESLRKRARTRRRAKIPTLQLPCERCKHEKRNQMQKAAERMNKRVNEKVWERWVNTPGNCLHFMHADEPVVNRDKQFDLSFSESETQSPSENHIRHESGVRIDTYGNTVDSEP